jgi:hypothetical protein
MFPGISIPVYFPASSDSFKPYDPGTHRARPLPKYLHKDGPSTLGLTIFLRASVNRRVSYASSDDTKAFLSY